jgi:hypothetical protein
MAARNDSHFVLGINNSKKTLAVAKLGQALSVFKDSFKQDGQK